MFFEIVCWLLVAYFSISIVVGGILFLGSLINYLQSGNGPSPADILLAAFFWPRTLWVIHKGQSFAGWKHNRELRKELFTKKKAQLLVNRSVAAGCNLDGVPKGTIGKITSIEKINSIYGQEEIGFIVRIIWNNSSNLTGVRDTFSKASFKEGEVALLQD